MAAIARLLPLALFSGEQLVMSTSTAFPPNDNVLGEGWAETDVGKTAPTTMAQITKVDTCVKRLISF